MLLGIFGPHAIGKSTFLDTNMDSWPEIVMPKGLVVVPADYEREFRYDPVADCWKKRKEHARWKGTREDKIAHMEHMVGDRSTFYIVESARYFSGFQPDLVKFYARYNGGLKFICVTCRPDAMRDFIMERCAKQKKDFREDYWDHKRLEYECRLRYVNQVTNHYIPAKIDVELVTIDDARSNWYDVEWIIEKWLQRPWYADHPGRIA